MVTRGTTENKANRALAWRLLSWRPARRQQALQQFTQLPPRVQARVAALYLKRLILLGALEMVVGLFAASLFASVYRHFPVILGWIVGGWLFRYITYDEQIHRTVDAARANPQVLDDLVLSKDRVHVAAVLNQLLPDATVQPNPQDIDELCRLLSPHITNMNWNLVSLSRSEADLRIAILHALSRFGTERAISTVQRIADSHPRTMQHRRVTDAARECLPRMQQRLGHLNYNLLLRPASTPTPDTLLRPASGGTTQDEALLLRPRLGGRDE